MKIKKSDESNKKKNTKKNADKNEKNNGNNENNEENKDGKVSQLPLTPIHVILNVIKIHPSLSGNCLGLLMNASLENAENNIANGLQSTGVNGSGSGVQNSDSNNISSVREIIAAAGGVELTLSGVMLGSKERILFFEQERPEGNKYFVCKATHNVLF